MSSLLTALFSHFGIVWMLVVSAEHMSLIFWVVKYGTFDHVRKLAVSPGVMLDVKVSVIHAYISSRSALYNYNKQPWYKCIILTLVRIYVS